MEKEVNRPLSIAIDGPVSAGKSTLSDALARKLGILHLDTGAMYRAVGLYALENGINPASEAALEEVIGNGWAAVSLEYTDGMQITLLNGQNVTHRLREEAVGAAASAVSRYPAVRRYLVDIQRQLARKQSLLIDGRDIGTVAEEVQAVLDTIPRPAGYELTVAGSFEEQQKAFGELLVSLVLALLLVYMVLACQYESLRDPVVVMASVPVAAVGVLAVLFVTRTTLNLQSFIGCIMLGGIVVNNAILLVDQAGQLVRDGMPVSHAVAEAGRRRLRPILMTTLTTILALLPLALGIGEGADQQAPLARAVVGGLTASTLITLVLIPAVYSLFHPETKGEAS